MLPRLREGRHPDWDESFWDRFEPSSDAEEPSQAGIAWAAFWNGYDWIVVAVLAFFAVDVFVIVWLVRRHRRNRARRAAAAVV